MPLTFRFIAPAIAPEIAIAAAAPAASRVGAEILLAASQPLVPVDKGDLKASGHVEQDGETASVIYDAVAPDGFAYGILQHEDLELNHPHGGQAKFLEQPMHTVAEPALAAMAIIYRAALA